VCIVEKPVSPQWKGTSSTITVRKYKQKGGNPVKCLGKECPYRKDCSDYLCFTETHIESTTSAMIHVLIDGLCKEFGVNRKDFNNEYDIMTRVLNIRIADMGLDAFKTTDIHKYIN
jgi:hypothetical protein